MSLPPLTPEQVTNWRNQLSVALGPYALLMPVSEIEKYRAKLLQRSAKADKR